MTNLVSNLEILLLNEAIRTNKHMCMDGTFVDCHSEECMYDIDRRVKDAVHARDNCKSQTDARSYYNGILRVLRRQLREVEKEVRKKKLSETKSRRKRLTSPRQTNRILKLSGIL
jgi:hypothetical protein|tara:strand:+ start:633 stop:977 length:345 start_codon:yes stop_codon:yes gene_type:complete